MENPASEIPTKKQQQNMQGERAILNAVFFSTAQVQALHYHGSTITHSYTIPGTRIAQRWLHRICHAILVLSGTEPESGECS